MVDVLIVPDGAAEPVRAGRPTSLERARTPALDAVRAAGALLAVATTPPGRAPGSETGLPVLLGLAPVPSRGALEAASAGLALAPGERAWRVDVHARDGSRAPEACARVVLRALAAAWPAHRVRALRGHRGLAIGHRAPRPTGLAAGWTVRVWGGEGALPAPPPPAEGVVVVCGPGAAAGCARLLGAELVVPPGATGGPGSDLTGKRDAGLAAVGAPGARLVVVHVGAPDEAAHARDPRGKVGAIEAVDALLVGPLWAAVAAVGGRLAVCPDHGTDPETGEHDGAPVPAVCAGHGVVPTSGGGRMTERAVRGLAVTASPWARAAVAA